MSDKLNLSVPEARGPSGPTIRPMPVLLAVLVALAAANLIVLLTRGPGGTAPAGGETAEVRKEVALKLERRDLDSAAADAWEDYADAAALEPEEAARVWYRIGRLHQAAGEHEQALAAYLKSETIARIEELSQEIDRRTKECLESLGRFAALRTHLAERVGLDQGEERGKVLAEIGPEKITEADLDRMIEERIERQFAEFAGDAPPEELKKQKEQALKQMSDPRERLRFLGTYINEELLYRRAREDNLAQEPRTRAALESFERRLLAQRAIEQAFAERIRITEGDVKTFFEANKERFKRPERARISIILAKDADGATKALEALKAGKSFAEVAKAHSIDEATKDNGGEVEAWVEKGAPVPGIGRSDEATAAIFSTEAGELVDTPVKTDRGVFLIQVRKREPEAQVSFAEAKSRAARALRSRKQREVQSDLLRELHAQHDVVIHQSAFGVGQPEAEPTKDEPKQDEPTK